MAVVEIVLGAVAAGGAWYAGVRLFPWKTCPRCGGAKRIEGFGGHRDCGRCGATGRVRRFGAAKQ